MLQAPLGAHPDCPPDDALLLQPVQYGPWRITCCHQQYLFLLQLQRLLLHIVIHPVSAAGDKNRSQKKTSKGKCQSLDHVSCPLISDCSLRVSGPAGQLWPAYSSTGQMPYRLLQVKTSSILPSWSGYRSAISTARPCPAASSSTCSRMMPATPLPLRAGVNSVFPHTKKTLLNTPSIMRPEVSSISPSAKAGSCHSARASTCSSRFRCFRPASRG